jgi:hypothetical protein
VEQFKENVLHLWFILLSGYIAFSFVANDGKVVVQEINVFLIVGSNMR